MNETPMYATRAEFEAAERARIPEYVDGALRFAVAEAAAAGVTLSPEAIDLMRTQLHAMVAARVEMTLRSLRDRANREE